MIHLARLLTIIIFYTGTHSLVYSSEISQEISDPHRNELGFFDIHVCNWPDRPPFFKSLFSTTRFDIIEDMTIFYPDGSTLTTLDKNDFMRIRKKGRSEKRVYLNDFNIPKHAYSGWYTIEVNTKDGKTFIAKDYVIMTLMPRASGMNPKHGAEDIAMPTELKWDPIAGASFYQVFVREAFENKRIIYSKLLSEPRYSIKPGKLEPGGLYIWSVHARDTNEHTLLGDFNHGSQSMKAEFSIAEDD